IQRGEKKSKTSETTSGSASSGFNLNNEADEFEKETQEHRPMGRDRSKAKKKSSPPLARDLIHLLICHSMSYLQDAQPESTRKTLAFSEAVLNFRVTELDELGPIIQKKKNKVRPLIRIHHELEIMSSPSTIKLIDIVLEITIPNSTTQRDGKGIAIDEQPESPPNLVPTSKEVRPDPDALILVPYEINGKNF
ncbi:hypothetical protein Tco_0889200, partial [Tanacetum coccineum]